MAYHHSIPTPPFSPNSHRLPSENAENPLVSTIGLLDSLTAFYQHERMWVYRTRAMLEQALEDTSDTASTFDEQSDPAGGSPRQDSRWMRRKQSFNLRLNGIRARRGTQNAVVDQAEREQLLSMFEKMMESRMESCQRVNRLVREAQRARMQYAQM